jgi:hypothetical protein
MEGGELSAESIGKMAFPGVALARDAKPVSPGAAGKIVDQRTLQREAVRPIRELQLETQNGNPGQAVTRYPSACGFIREVLAISSMPIGGSRNSNDFIEALGKRYTASSSIGESTR